MPVSNISWIPTSRYVCQPDRSKDHHPKDRDHVHPRQRGHRPQESFAERMLEILNSGALSIMISIGHRSGLFDAMAGRGPRPAPRSPNAAGLNERYVREWLGRWPPAGS
jgi:hypothetical protein